MFKKTLIALLVGVACCLNGLASADMHRYFIDYTVGKADGWEYSPASVETVTRLYENVANPKQKLQVNLLSMSYHNPECMDQYICSYETFSDTVSYPVKAVAYEGNSYDMKGQNPAKLSAYDYDVASLNVDFKFYLTDNKLKITEGKAKQYVGATKYTGNYDGKKCDSIRNSPLATLMLVKTLDYKLAMQKYKGSMDLSKPNKTFEVVLDYEARVYKVNVYNKGKLFCNYLVDTDYKNVSLHKNNMEIWNYKSLE